MVRVALITGASRGIGAATALVLAKQGYRVVVNHRDSAPQAGEVVATIAAAGGEAMAIKADVTVPNDVTAMVDEIDQRWGGTKRWAMFLGVGAMASARGRDARGHDAPRPRRLARRADRPAGPDPPPHRRSPPTDGPGALRDGRSGRSPISSRSFPSSSRQHAAKNRPVVLLLRTAYRVLPTMRSGP